jgi:hypothetical protein
LPDNDTRPLTSPYPLLRELSGELGWGLAMVRAVVLQAGHPQIAAALMDDSQYVDGASALPAPALVRLADVLFDVTDTDHSGTISAQEYRKLLHTCFAHQLATTPGGDLTQAAFTTEFLHFMAGRRPDAAWEGLTTDS